jgi:hypothetical protein
MCLNDAKVPKIGERAIRQPRGWSCGFESGATAVDGLS